MSNSEKIEQLYSPKAPNYIKLERYIFIPAKILLAYPVYAHANDGVFYILAYLIYCAGMNSARQFNNIQELNNTLNTLKPNILSSISHDFEHIERQLDNLKQRIQK